MSWILIKYSTTNCVALQKCREPYYYVPLGDKAKYDSHLKPPKLKELEKLRYYDIYIHGIIIATEKTTDIGQKLNKEINDACTDNNTINAMTNKDIEKK